MATKQRLVGMIVLISLGLILVPILFSNQVPTDNAIHTSIQLPPPPPMPSSHVASQSVAADKNTEVRDTVNIPDVWVVQLGVFSDQHNATKLISTLRAKGFPAFTKLSKDGSAATTRVYIGPEISQEKARVVASQLQKVFKIKGMVVRHKL